MQTIVIIDTNDLEAQDIDIFLKGYKYKTVRIHEVKKGVELTKSVLPELIVIAAGGATLVGILAALMPARRAANLDPVVAIRG